MLIRGALICSFLAGAIGCSASPGPAPAVTVSPASMTLTAGGPAATFTASSTSATASFSWSLTGDGSLSVATGPSASYTPPASVAASETVTLTVTAGGRSGQATITVNPEAAPAVTTRTVSSALKTQFTKDDGTTTVVSGWATEMDGATVAALLVPDSSAAGYTSFPVTVAADGTFSVANVPEGPYFIQIDSVIKVVHAAAISRTLYRTTSSTPDLTLFVFGRADRTATTSVLTPLQLDVTGLTPLADPAAIKFPALSQLTLISAQTPIYNRSIQTSITPKPQPGDTSLSGSIEYGETLYLADASKGDVTYLYERDHQELGTGASAASYYFTRNYLRSDSLTVPDVTGATLSGAMVAAPQTGSVHANLKLSQFAALASAVHPSAQPGTADPEVPTTPVLTVFALEHAPPLIERIAPEAPMAVLNIDPQSAADVDYGALAYGRLPESSWSDFVQVVYSYNLTLPFPDGSSGGTTEVYVKNAFVSSAPDSFAPALSPPGSPRLDSKDALLAQAAAGLTPLVSWSAPATGTPGSYRLQLYIAGGDVQDGDVGLFTVAGLYGTSFRIPKARFAQA
jgi:hypothetical protein